MLGGAEDLGGRGDVLGSDGFAVPAYAFGVGLAEEVFVGFTGPFEGCFELVSGHFVVMVNELSAAEEGVLVVGSRRDVPSQVNIQGWDTSMQRILGHDLDESHEFTPQHHPIPPRRQPIFLNPSRLRKQRRLQLIQHHILSPIHLLNARPPRHRLRQHIL